MQIPFPHILTLPTPSNENTFRFVTAEEVNDTVIEKDRTQRNPETDQMESVYLIYGVDEVIEKRKAKGNWTNWESHPTYYNTKGRYIGQQFKSNIGTDKFI